MDASPLPHRPPAACPPKLVPCLRLAPRQQARAHRAPPPARVWDMAGVRPLALLALLALLAVGPVRGELEMQQVEVRARAGVGGGGWG